MTDEFDTSLRHSPFVGGVDVSRVFEDKGGMDAVPTSAIEDIGFTPEQLAFIRDGLYNADFRTPPPEGSGVELDNLENKLPGWTYVKEGTDVTIQWLHDVTGGHLGFFSTGVSADQAYVEQIFPISSTIAASVTQMISVYHDASAGTPGLWAALSYLDADGVDTGSYGYLDLDPTQELVEVTGPDGGIPSDAHFLKVEIGVVATDIAGVSVNGVRVQNVTVRPGLWWVTTGSDPDDWAPGGADRWESTTWIGIDGGAADRTISGLLAPAVLGTRKTIHNAGATNNIILEHDAGGGSGSAAGNRFYCQSDVDLTISPHGSVDIFYAPDADGTHLRWRVMTP